MPCVLDSNVFYGESSSQSTGFSTVVSTVNDTDIDSNVVERIVTLKDPGLQILNLSQLRILVEVKIYVIN